MTDARWPYRVRTPSDYRARSRTRLRGETACRAPAESMRRSGYAAGAARGARRAPLPVSLPSTVHARPWHPARPPPRSHDTNRLGITAPASPARVAERLPGAVTVQPLGWVDAGLRVPSLRVSWALCGSLSGCQGLAWTVLVLVLRTRGEDVSRVPLHLFVARRWWREPALQPAAYGGPGGRGRLSLHEDEDRTVLSVRCQRCDCARSCSAAKRGAMADSWCVRPRLDAGCR